MAVQLQATIAVLVLVALFGSIADTQSDFKLFTGTDEHQLDLLSQPELLQIAAKAGDQIVVQLTEASQSGVAQEGVNITIDCLPWLNRFPGGSIEWTFIQLDEFGNAYGGKYICSIVC